MRIPVALRWLIGISLPIVLLVLLFRWVQLRFIKRRISTL